MGKVSRTEFIKNVSTRSGFSEEDTIKFYDAFIKEIEETMRQGKSLTLTGFGNFFIAKHKGHPVQFSKEEVKDYVVFKFSCSNVLNKKFRDEYEKGLLKVKD